MFMPAIRRAFDDMQRPRRREARFVGVRLDIFGDAVDERVSQPLADRPFAPGEILDPRFLAGLAFVAVGQGQQPFGPVRTAVASTTSSQAASSSGSMLS